MDKIENLVYESDASNLKGKAVGVVFPASSIEISNIIKLNSNIVPRGGGSGLAGGAVPENSLVLDMSKMNHFLSFDGKKKEVEVEAGIILDELNKELEKYGLEFPVQPSSHAICTIGGMIATNAAGSRAIKYGKTIDWIKELEVINGRGEILKIEKTCLSDIAGMEGITGIIAKARLKLIDKPERTASLFQFEDIDKVLDVIGKLKLVKDVSMIEFIDKKASAMLGMEDKYHIIAEFENDKGKLKGDNYKEVMEMRDKIYPVLAYSGYNIIEDPMIFLHKMKEMIIFLEKNNIPFYGHMGIGVIHPCFKEEQKKLIKHVLTLAKELHGKVTGEHGYGLAKKEFIDAIDKKLILRIKNRYDSQNKINPGKVIDIDKEDIGRIEQENKIEK